MKHSAVLIYFAKKRNRIIFLLIAFFFSACLQKNDDTDPNVKRQLYIADSLMVAGRNGTADKMLVKIRPNIPNTSPSLVTYYAIQARINMYDNAKQVDLYADSAMGFFKTESQTKKYPKEYYEALLTKGRASVQSKKYVTALNYYYRCRKVLANGVCDNGDLAGNIGFIFYSQKNFELAAKYWSESYARLGSCNETANSQKLFFNKQGALNNTGYSYYRAGVLDSARKYYLEDIELIEKAQADKVVEEQYIRGALSVVYDNLGGLNLKLGDLPMAEKYLIKCLDLNNTYADGVRIPPLLKLAEIYIKQGSLDKASASFAEARQLLNRFEKDNPESLVKYYKLYAQYLYKVNRPAAAYTSLARYNNITDSLDNNSAQIYRLDVERELTTIEQHQELTTLEVEAKEKRLYFAGFVVFVVLLGIIIFLVSKNLKRTQKSHKLATGQNEQLQHTLGELERVNKNYIRVMRVMAHDLKNPLSGMTGLTAMLLEEEDLSEENKHILKLIENTGNNSMVMINDLLRSGLADDDEKIVTQCLDLRSLLYDSVELLRFKAAEKQQIITFKSTGGAVMANVSHEKIWRVINNIIVNAIKFSYPGGVIRIALESNQKKIVISVADNGVGIPDEQKDHVFDMFTPAKKAGTSGEEPFGLGLSISKKIIEKHNGRIWFESTIGQGTTFYMELPVAG